MVDGVRNGFGVPGRRGRPRSWVYTAGTVARIDLRLFWSSVTAAEWSGSKRTRAGASEDGGRAEPCRAPQLRQLRDWVANCLVSMSMATPIATCPNTFQDSIKPLHRGRARSHAPAEAA